MNSYHFNSDELILLLGEGNFSFSLALLQLNKRQSEVKFNNFYSTCYESDLDCSDTVSNIAKINSYGFNVRTGVDATKLSEHPEIGAMKFNKIIFNFPHIKGKMKINLNRDLIKEFFISSKSVLCDGGVVVIALCSGQGGTPFDKNLRKWENTWQVVEMAAQGNYVLTKVHLFPNEIFPQYISSGFRGKCKSFNTVNALVHEFSLSSPPPVSIDEDTLNNLMSYHDLPGHGNIKVPFIYSKILHKLPLTTNSPQTYLKNVLLSTGENIPGLILSEELPMTVNFESKDNVVCRLGEDKKFLRKSLIEVLPDLNPGSNIVFCGVVFKNLSSNFAMCPVKCEILIVGSFCKNLCNEYINKLKYIFSNNIKLEWVVIDSKNTKIVLVNSKNELKELIVFKTIKQEENNFEICVLDLDGISISLFELESWKQLWSENSIFMTVPKLHFSVPSLYSQLYSFDINFITTPQFNLDSFVNLLWQISDNLIAAVLLLNTYKHSDNDQTISHCYRIVYKSYDKPLFRKRVVNFHENVIGKALQILYNVVIS